MKVADLHQTCPICRGTGFGQRVECGSVKLSPLCILCKGGGTASKFDVARFRMENELPPDALVRDVIEEGGL